MDRETAKRVQDLELMILKHVDSICRKNNIKYYLIGGTLIGAIRHKGFIPWDDDIDIAMYRDDYNRFTKAFKETPDPRFFLQSFKTDPHYLRYFRKVRLNGTCFLEHNAKQLEMHHGIFIDIFLLDRIILSNKRLNLLRAVTASALLKLKIIKEGFTKGSSSFRTFVYKALRPFALLIPSAFFEYLLDHIYGISNKSKRASHTTNFACRYGWKIQTVPNEVYGDGVLVDFEGQKYMAPANWDFLLKQVYGDYMKLPPVEKRESGHDVVHVDLGSYMEM